MKKLFKLAAIAVSMALVTSLVACSSGDDDVVDATTPKYLLNNQIDNYVESIEYDQNVLETQVTSLEEAHEAVMEIISDCADCLEVYFTYYLKPYTSTDKDRPLTPSGVDYLVKYLEAIKKDYGTHEKCTRLFVYKDAVKDAIKTVKEAGSKVEDIGIDPKGDTIAKGELNEKQVASMEAYTDAVEALKSVLDEDDKKLDSPVDKAIKAADREIKAFNELKNKNVTKVKIYDVIYAVNVMCGSIETDVVDRIYVLVK